MSAPLRPADERYLIIHDVPEDTMTPPASTPAATPPRRRTGRPPKVSRDQLIAAALKIIDNPPATGGGYADLTVGAVTKACDVKYSTFYRHFPSIDELVHVCVDHHLAGVEWPDPAAGRRRYLDDLSHALVELEHAHRGIGTALLTLQPHPHALTEVQTATVRVLMDGGADNETAWNAAQLIINIGLLPGMPGALWTSKRRAQIELVADGLVLRIDGAPR